VISSKAFPLSAKLGRRRRLEKEECLGKGKERFKEFLSKINYRSKITQTLHST